MRVFASNVVGESKGSNRVKGRPTSVQDCYSFIPYANLQDCDLVDINLSSANLTGANFTDANLTGANLTDANLTGANLTGANLADANLLGVTWSNTTCPDGSKSDNHDGTCVGYGIATVPDPPTDVTAAAGDESASVTWVPGFDEGSPIASYTVTATGDGGDETCTYDVPENGETDTCTVGGTDQRDVL